MVLTCLHFRILKFPLNWPNSGSLVCQHDLLDPPWWSLECRCCLIWLWKNRIPIHFNALSCLIIFSHHYSHFFSGYVGYLFVFMCTYIHTYIHPSIHPCMHACMHTYIVVLRKWNKQNKHPIIKRARLVYTDIPNVYTNPVCRGWISGAVAEWICQLVMPPPSAPWQPKGAKSREVAGVKNSMLIGGYNNNH